MSKSKLNHWTSTVSGTTYTGTSTSSSTGVVGETVQVYKRSPAASQNEKNLESAVYAVIQGMRALGRTQINTTEIAAALSVPLSEVHRVIAALQKKGVKLLQP